MSSDWPLKELVLIADEVTVGYVGPMATEYVESGIPFLRSLNIDQFNINSNDLKYVTPEFHHRIKKSSLHPGDVAIVRTGKPGTCAVIPDWLQEANCSDLVIVRCGREIRPHFLCYWVNSKATHHIESHTVGAVQQHFNVGAAKTMKVAVPSLHKQDQVLELLRGLDDRITLLRETNTTLEAIAQALFKSWFVDFDPVRAKQEGREPEGMDADTAALFPDSFEESELGLVPKGWHIGSIGQIAEVIDCLHSKKPELISEGWPFLQLSNIRDDGLLDASNVSCITEADYRKWISRIEVSEGDCVITNVGRVGAVAQIPSGFKAAMGRNMTAMRLKHDWPYPTYLIELLQSSWMRTEIKRRTDVGTILDALNVRNIPELRCVLAPSDVMRNFELSSRPLRASMEANLERANNLATLRDTLLPRLISGQLRLPDAEAMDDEVLIQSVKDRLEERSIKVSLEL